MELHRQQSPSLSSKGLAAGRGARGRRRVDVHPYYITAGSGNKTADCWIKLK